MEKAVPHFWSQFVICKHEIKTNHNIKISILKFDTNFIKGLIKGKSHLILWYPSHKCIGYYW